MLADILVLILLFDILRSRANLILFSRVKETNRKDVGISGNGCGKFSRFAMLRVDLFEIDNLGYFRLNKFSMLKFGIWIETKSLILS